MKKIFSSLILISLAICMVFGMTGCSNDTAKDEIRLAVYETRYNGDPMNTYPDRVLTDDTVLDMLLAGSGNGPLDIIENVEVMCKLKYMNSDNEEITVIIQTTGKVTFMRIGLPMEERWLTESEFADVMKYIWGNEG